MLAVRRSSLNILTKTVRTVSPSTVRAFTVTAYKNELLQDLFLKELKNTKFDMASLQSPESIAENVIKFSAPTKPKIPTLEAAQKDTLQDYINENVETSLDTAADAAAVQQDVAQDEDWLVIEDEPEESHH
ncbi:similar to Saccharomyces cerevisiae YLR295C ATP14 Subunit h of the F0 sector of mitochondrial F1F0 ATP synthase [Maudiozyma barnettii]|uniref:Similar to Saccharomyces cerevisiae YLR295C ATP14 Subunit h of the F0 sector of mitochondrial F1F0 ATP synthase n=1 Tax=Maudiozyma barnettii TaxID=61262 RepID=A0A8H2VF13_9SACH|nr:F1F0 ATP synthase subunit h [Kazachstania barnettii]CAB4254337.1 similar to Saccharomyces cerevisiae YLR295C ATP14 Subunit h of the F0 sector of mitochondrial F1F0 ATP synthase [Kazachstania barnettii]CAD1782185.1 similar to Saccharomyces cerevisiae YLR295C ATP14 Subunit h of the F0 sector of mitochondrial F1F0 ATP synthase [Kazachstania barnettii]